MQIQISTRHGHLSDASQERVAEKAEKLLRIFERLTAIEGLPRHFDAVKARLT